MRNELTAIVASTQKAKPNPARRKKSRKIVTPTARGYGVTAGEIHVVRGGLPGLGKRS